MSARSPKSALVRLRLSPDLLARFPVDSPARKTSRPKSSSSSTPADTPADPMIIEPSPSQDASEAVSTPLPNGATPIDGNSLAPPQNGVKRKGVPGPKPGSKRGAAETMPKPRGKPGPKKKPRLSELNGDASVMKGPFAGVVPITTQKLGPKANQGAINAGLRALDRSGKPCRKWEKKGFQLKSFTGVAWSVPTWRTPKKSTVDENGDVKSDTTGTSETNKVNESSAVASEKSSSGGGNMDTPNRAMPLPNVPSSPIPSMTPV
ncbi:uncharacterized protein K452DRAFT_310378 [Aplosporella prunicola CBS 121167]|uniref:INO80 complex, subunit Ies4 n=1 Tax=Aplosporella prunicola CBS 121167 TaxID=1176127 RepID=A0A6A6B8Y7_9PEZI|nr:uncharacterized protein K452DRAFT_310378 [Aplosporella prunicola CBS 121167]KAF2140028.1 hypothetical protein K452DRAFT_310378 [Aplosporella prunicola CBS 121167]